MTSSTRNAHLAMADDRAMEEQHERHNPVNPKGLLHNRRETMMRNIGSGATPSMGLSQIRGGKHTLLDHMKNPTKGYGKPLLPGATQRKKMLPGATMSEAHGMGNALGKHLYGLHGKGFWNDFKQGFNSVVAPVAGVVKHIAPLAGPEGMAVSGALGAMGYGRCGGRREMSEREQEEKGFNGAPQQRSGLSVAEMRQQHNAKAKEDYKREHPIASAIGEYGMKGVRGLTDVVVEHGDKVGVPKGAIDFIKESKKLAEGSGKTGHSEGKGKKKRAPAGASDGRRKRAEVVKQVMAEKGMKMIEASKYVKEHGLY
jgi:hypothetical protein